MTKGTLHMCHSEATWNIGILWTICNGNVGIGGFLKMALVLEKSETNGLGTPKPIQWAGGARWCPQVSSPQTQQLADSWVSSLVLVVGNKKSLASPKSLDGLLPRMTNIGG